MIYLASPYTNSDPNVVEYRVKTVCEVSAKLMCAGHIIFSPIAHTHPIAIAGDLPTNWEFWEKFDRDFIKFSDELWVAKMEGWEKSKGVTAEIKIALELGKQIRFLDVETLDVDPS